MTQKQQVANYLQSGKSLTPIVASGKFGTLRLASIIYRLNDEGMKSQTESIKVDKGRSKFVAKYSIK